MKRNDILIGIFVLAVIAGIVYYVRRPKPDTSNTPTVTEETLFEDTFKYEIPDDVEKAMLRDVTGEGGTGIATRKYESGTFTHAVLADLPDPTGGFYEGWLVKGSDFFSTGKMRLAKGGYLLEYTSPVDHSDYDKVVITFETADDETPEAHVLEGSF